MKSGRFVGPDRAEVVGNIRRAVAAKAFNIKVEEHDPVFSKVGGAADCDTLLTTASGQAV